MNTFLYVSADPISKADPLGLAEYLGLGNIVGDLDWLASIQGDNFWKSNDFRPERQMLERLRSGMEIPWDGSFYHHEINEAQMCMQYRGLPSGEALRETKKVHDYLERVQGGTVFSRYHPS